MERPGYPCMVVVFKGHTVVLNALCQVFSDGGVPGQC